MKDVYINRVSAFLPNEPVENDEMEDYLGYVNGQPSRSKPIILRRNGIKKRHYAFTKDGEATHTNAELTTLAIKALFENDPKELESIELLTCGTSTPDQFFPSHAVMVHGCLPETKNIEVISPAGVCCAGMHALKYAFMSVKMGATSKAIATGSERVATLLRADNYQEEIEKLKDLEENPYIGFEKDFLRWMLSDGAGAFLLEDKKNDSGLSIRIDWMEACSFANRVESCMYMGAEKEENGELKSFKDYSPKDCANNSVFSIKQDVKLLSDNIVALGSEFLASCLAKHNANIEDINYFLPHLSSFVFKEPIANILKENGLEVPDEKWFTNLAYKGNLGAGSIYLMIDELFNENKLKAGDQLLVMVPESSRFSYVFAWMTVC